MRTSFVVGRDRGAGGGAMSTLRMIARLGLGGKVGKGTQGMSWIHESDLNGLFARAITENSMTGVYIASAPNPVSQIEFMRTLRKVIGMPIGLTAFEWMVRIGAPLFLRTIQNSPFTAATLYPSGWLTKGFVFQFPNLEAALRDLYDGN